MRTLSKLVMSSLLVSSMAFAQYNNSAARSAEMNPFSNNEIAQAAAPAATGGTAGTGAAAAGAASGVGMGAAVAVAAAVAATAVVVGVQDNAVSDKMGENEYHAHQTHAAGL